MTGTRERARPILPRRRPVRGGFFRLWGGWLGDRIVSVRPAPQEEQRSAVSGLRVAQSVQNMGDLARSWKRSYAITRREERGVRREGVERRKDARRAPGGRRVVIPHASRPTPRALVGCGFGGAMVVAPFLALLFDVAAGLAVMAVGLGATAYLAEDAGRTAEVGVRRKLRWFAVVNGVLAGVCLVVLVVRVV